MEVQNLSVGGELLIQDGVDRYEVFRMSNVNLKESLSIPLSASEAVTLLNMANQRIQVADYFQGLIMRLADVFTHVTDHARRASDEQAGPERR